MQNHASTVAHPPNSPPQNDTKGSMVDISQGVYRPHWVNQTTRLLTEQHIQLLAYVYPELPNPRCRLPLRSPGRGDTLPGESVIDRLD